MIESLSKTVKILLDTTKKIKRDGRYNEETSRLRSLIYGILIDYIQMKESAHKLLLELDKLEDLHESLEEAKKSLKFEVYGEKKCDT